MRTAVHMEQLRGRGTGGRPSYSEDGEELVAAIRGLEAPLGTQVTGPSAALVDTKASLSGLLPVAGAIIAFRPGDPFQIAIGLWVLVHGITSLLLAAPGFPWPHPPEELVDRLITDHLQGLLPRS
jgi:hypothetical protein